MFNLIFTVSSLSFRLLLDSQNSHAPEENLENRLHIIDKHFLKVLFLGFQSWILLLLPHFEYNALVYVPVFNMLFEVLKQYKLVQKFIFAYLVSLRFLLSIFGHPVAISCIIRLNIKIISFRVLTISFFGLKLPFDCVINVVDEVSGNGWS